MGSGSCNTFLKNDVGKCLPCFRRWLVKDKKRGNIREWRVGRTEQSRKPGTTDPSRGERKMQGKGDTFEWVLAQTELLKTFDTDFSPPFSPCNGCRLRFSQQAHSRPEMLTMICLTHGVGDRRRATEWDAVTQCGAAAQLSSRTLLDQMTSITV